MAICCLFVCPSFDNISRNVVHINFSSVWVAEWPPSLKELLTRLTICSLCLLTITLTMIEGWIWVPIASVPGLCILASKNFTIA